MGRRIEGGPEKEYFWRSCNFHNIAKSNKTVSQ